MGKIQSGNLAATISVVAGLTATISTVAGLTATISSGARAGPGKLEEITVTPAESVQVITPRPDVYGFSKVTVAPIPSNYGRIIYNGIYLKVE